MLIIYLIKILLAIFAMMEVHQSQM